MITPFENKEAYKIVRNILWIRKNKVIHDLEKYLEYLNNRVYRQHKKNIINIYDAYTVWVYACIFDDIGNNNDYSQTCIYKGNSYADKYIKARENIREEFNSTQLFSKKHIYNMPDILCDLGNLLYSVKGDNADSGLIRYMKHIGLEEEFKKDLGRLIRSIRKYITNIRDVYSKEFG